MGCCNNKNTTNIKNDLPREEMLNYTSILTALLDIVRTGKIPALFKNPAADELAKMIANLVDENKYLRAILGVMRPDVAVTDEAFKISFGPGQNYVLTIPVTTEGERAELIARLEDAIVKLKSFSPPPSPADGTKQLLLFMRN